MAMFVQKFTTGNFNLLPVKDHPRSFSVGERCVVPPEEVFSVQCDGHELGRALRIIGRSDNLPSRVFTFYGYEAQMIVGNWSNV